MSEGTGRQVRDAAGITAAPDLGELDRRKLAESQRALNAGETSAEAAEAVRQPVEEARLEPEDGVLAIKLPGDPAALFRLACEPCLATASGVQVTLTAGKEFARVRTSFGLRKAV